MIRSPHSGVIITYLGLNRLKTPDNNILSMLSEPACFAARASKIGLSEVGTVAMGDFLL